MAAIGTREAGTMTKRLFLVALCSLGCVPLTHAQSRNVEAAFAAVPFREWSAEGAKAELPWHPRITSTKLTLHQRIAVGLEVELDGNELVKRCCDGQAIALVEIRDQQGLTYRNYGGKDLNDAKPGLRQSIVSLSWQVFLLPGEYQATIAFYYSGRKGHSLTSRRIHVASLKHEPLPGAWQDLPAVEFCDPQPEGLDALLLPNIEGRLRLPAKASRRIEVEILENLTPYPSEGREPKRYTDRLSVFLPILKTFSQLQVENGSLGLSLLDFTRRSVIFDQREISQGQVSWAKLKDAIAADSVTSVDVHDLEHGEQFGEFFGSEVTRRLDETPSDGALRVLIVISGPMDLGSRAAIEIAPSARGNFAVFYVRCDFLQTSAFVEQTAIFAASAEPSQQNLERSMDGIGKALRELKPRVFAVDSAERVRDALAAISRDISRM